MTATDNVAGTPKSFTITANNGATISNIVVGAFGVATTFDITAPNNPGPGTMTVRITYTVTDQADLVTVRTQDILIAEVVPAAPSGFVFDIPSETVSWNPVPGAASYTVENVTTGGSVYA